jgi:hypothetical protein
MLLLTLWTSKTGSYELVVQKDSFIISTALTNEYRALKNANLRLHGGMFVDCYSVNDAA